MRQHSTDLGILGRHAGSGLNFSAASFGIDLSRRPGIHARGRRFRPDRLMLTLDCAEQVTLAMGQARALRIDAREFGRQSSFSEKVYN